MLLQMLYVLYIQKKNMKQITIMLYNFYYEKQITLRFRDRLSIVLVSNPELFVGGVHH